MTPKQRETLATAKGYHAAKAFEYRETLDEAMAEKHQRVVDAIAAALAPAPTCGTCKHDKFCGIQAVCVSSRFTDKRVTGCIGAYEAKTPTEPTR